MRCSNQALSDGPNAWPLQHMKVLLTTLKQLDDAVKRSGFAEPLIALYLAAVWLGETVDRRTVAASVVAFAGVLVIFLGQARADLGYEAVLGSVAHEVIHLAACPVTVIPERAVAGIQARAKSAAAS